MPKTPKAEGPDKTAFEIMSRLVKQPPKTHDEMTTKKGGRITPPAKKPPKKSRRP